MNIFRYLFPEEAAVNGDAKKNNGRWPLDLPLVHFSRLSADTWTLRDACQGVLIMGENGSGKTSGSGELLARKYLNAGFGGLVLCFKTDEADLWRAYLRRAGRESDARFFGVNEAYRFNFLDYEANTSGVDFAENLVTLLVDIASIQKRTEATGSEAHFWLPQKKKLIRNAISLLLLAQEPVQLSALYEMILAAPKSQDEVSAPSWQSGSCLFHLLECAEEKARKTLELEMIKRYWLVERPALPPKTRETIDADFTGMFDPLTRGKIGELFGTDTNLSPTNILEGNVVVIDIPIAKYREVGQYAALIWAQLFQRAVDRRRYQAPGDRPVFLWEDEAHYFTIEQDALFQTTARSKGISVVRLTQNLPNFLDAYGRDGKHKVDTLLGNHATKIFHRNGDPTTNEWASRVIAKETAYKQSVSSSGSIQSGSGFNNQFSVSEVEEESCPPKEFIGLKNGGARNKFIVEGILFQSGRMWLKDRRWVVRHFKQI
jgi:TraM recognition site of TraD and TraG